MANNPNTVNLSLDNISNKVSNIEFQYLYSIKI